MLKSRLALVATIMLAGGLATAAEPHRPVIAINMNVPDGEALTNTNFTLRSTYVDAVVAAGGLPILVPPITSAEHIAQYAALADGFVFVGGPDINPARFGQEPHETWVGINPRREEFDFAFMEQALETGKPILAVCLGMQQLNVTHKGSMIQDIPSIAPSDVDHRPGGASHAHDVTIVAGTRLHALLGTTTIPVNSIHHQACVVAPNGPLIVAAKAPDGIVEAIELPGHRFAIGVQWHPEFLFHEDPQLNIFNGLVKEAANKTAGGEKPKS